MEPPISSINLSDRILGLVRSVSNSPQETFEPNIIENVLRKEPDITDRIQDILSQPANTPEAEWLQLRDITYYLSFAESHLTKAEAAPLHKVITKIKQIIHKKSDSIKPPWEGLIDAISKEITKDKLPSEKPLKSHLETHKATPITTKSFAHIHAEQYIADTGLEGTLASLILEQLLVYLNQYSELSPELKELKEELTELSAIFKEFDIGKPKTPAEVNAITKQFCEQLDEKITKLPPGKGLLIPTGWIGDPNGHQMYLQIKRVANHLTGILYNSGSGIQKYHPFFYNSGQVRVQPFIEHSQISESELTSSSFLKAQLELNCSLKDEKNRGTEYNQDDAYIHFQSLKGIEAPYSDQAYHYIKPKGVGVCTWGALLAILLHDLQKNEFRSIHYDIRLKSVCDFFIQIKEAKEFKEQDEMLLQKAAEQFARDVLIDYREETINHEELEKVKATLQIIFEYLDQQRRAKAFVSDNTRELELKNIDKLPKREGIVLEIPDAYEIRAVKQAPATAKVPAIPPFEDLSLLRYPPETLQRLTAFRTWLNTLKENQVDLSAVDEPMAHFFENLPRPNQEVIWDSIPIDQVSSVMKEIAEICYLGRTGVDNPMLAIGMLKALAINWSLYHRYLKHQQGVSWLRMPGNLPLNAILSEIIGTEFGGRPKTNRNCDNPVLRNELKSIVESLKRYEYDYHPDFFPCSYLQSYQLFNYEFPYRGQCEEPKWIEDQADNPVVRDKLEATDPEWASKPKFKRCAELVKDFDGNYLDPAFCAVKKNVFTLVSLLYSSQQYLPLHPKNFRVEEKRASVEFIPNDIFNKGYYHHKLSSIPYGITAHSSKEQILNKIVGLMRTCHFEKTEVYLTENRIKFIEKQYPDLANSKELTFELLKELCTIMSSGDYDGPDPHMELQPSKVLGFFTNNLHMLTQKQYQDLFNLLFFEGNFLEILLQKNSNYIQIIESFMTKCLAFFSDQGDYISQAFILEQAQFVSTIAKTKYPFKDFNPEEQISHWLKRPDLSDEERVCLSIHLVRYYSKDKKELSEEAVLNLLEACFLISLKWGSINIEKYFPSTEAVSNIKNEAMKVHWDNIQNRLLASSGPALLNKLCQRLKVQPPSVPWDLSLFPLCTAKNIRLHVKKLEITTNESPYIYLPIYFKNHSKFTNTFKKDSYLAINIGENGYEFIDEFNRKAIVRISSVVVGVDIQYELEPNQPYLLLDSVPNEIKNAGGSQTLTEKETLWQSLSKGEKVEFVFLDPEKKPTTKYTFISTSVRLEMEEKITLFFTNFEGKYLADEPTKFAFYLLLVNLPSSLTIKKLRIHKRLAQELHNRDPLSFNHPIIKEFLNKEHSIPALKQLADLLVTFSEKPIGKLEKVEKILQDGSKLQLVDIYSEKTVFKMFEQFSGKNEINLWKNEKGELVLLEIPRFGLSFEMKKVDHSWKALSNDYPNFKLSANQKVKGLDDFQGGLVIENDKDERERKLLLPRLQLVQTETGTLTRQFNYKTGKSNVSLSYPIQPKEGVVADTREKQLLMAQLHLMRKDYAKAHQFLLKSYSKVVTYTKEEIEILTWITQNSHDSKDGDLRSKAIVLLALSLLLKSEPHYFNTKPDDHSFWKIVDDAVSAYRDLSQWPDLKLNRDDEKLLIKGIFKNHPKGRLENYWLLGALKEEFQEESTSLGTIAYTSPIEKEKTTIEVPTGSTFLNWCSQLDSQASRTNILNPLITRPGGTFTKEILKGTLYELIKKQAPGVLVQLGFAQKDSSINPFFVDLMNAVHQSPEKFPDSKVLKRCIENVDFHRFNEGFIKPYNELRKSTDKAPFKSTKIKEITKSQKETLVASSIQTAFNIKQPTSILNPEQLANNFTEVPFVGIQLNNHEIQELQEAVEVKGSPLAEKKTKELQDDIQAAWANPKAKRPFLPSDKIDSLKTSLLIQKAEQTKLLNLEMESLLAGANKLPTEAAAAAKLSVERQATLKQEITFHDLCICLINHNSRALQNKNPSLTPAEISKLLNSTLQCLQRAKLVQKLNRSLVNLDDMESFKEKPDLYKNIDYLDLSQKLKENLTAPSAYNVEEKPEYSLFEYLANIQLYPNQVIDLDTLIKAEGKNTHLIMQKIMGSGKSKVFLPILALKKADGNRLPVIVVPSALYQTTLRDMDATSGKIFEQPTNTITFTRSSDYSFKALHKIRTEMEKMIANREYVLVTDVTLHTLHDQFKEMLVNYLTINFKLPKEQRKSPPLDLIELRHILSLLKTGILDEADQLLHQRFEVNFTTGKPEPISPKHTEVVRDIFECIYSTPEVMAKIVPTEKKHVEEPSFTQSSWDKEIKPLLISEFIKFEMKRETPLGKFLRDANRALIVDYWMNGNMGDQYVARLEDYSMKKLLAIAKGEFHELLSFTLNRPISYKYGKSDNPNEILAVPYVGNTKPNPSPNAQFGNPYELLNYCSQLYLIEGVSQPVLRAIVDRIKTMVMQEMSKDPSLTVQQTSAYQEFVDLTGKDVSMNLMRMNDRDFATLETHYKENKSLVFDFLSRYIYPRVEIYEGKIVSNHLDLVDLFSESVLGFSGTPYNKEMYHSRMHTQIEKGTDGKTLGILKKNSSQKIHAISQNTYSAILDELFKDVGVNSPVRTFQDTAALFNGIANEVIAEEILRRAPHLLGVRYYDTNNQMQVLERRGNKFITVPLEKTQTTHENSFTYFSQLDTTGKDTLQIDQAVGFATIGKTLTSRDLFQGVWRLRKLDKNQIAELVHVPEVADFIRKELGLKADAPIGFDEIVRFTRVVEIRELESQLPGNVMQKITHVIENKVEKMALDSTIDLSELIDSAPIIEKLFSHKQGDDPYQSFGRRERKVNSDSLVEEKVNEGINVVEQLKKTCTLFRTWDTEKLKEQMIATVNTEILPKEMISPVRTNRDMTIEVQREVQQEQETNIQRLKQLQQEMESSDPNKDPHFHWNWLGSPADQEIVLRENFQPTAPILLHQDMHARFPGAKHLLRAQTDSTGTPPICRMTDIMKFTEIPGEDIFDLLASYNFLPMASTYYLRSKGISQYAVPFDKRQMDVNHYLILRQSTGFLEMMLITNAEAGYFYSRLEREQGKPRDHIKHCDIFLGHIALGVIQSTKPEINKELEESYDFLRLITQAKFFKGELNYTKKEQEYLRGWIKRRGIDRMEEFFYKEVLRHRPNQRESYPRSVLGKLFQAVRKESLV